MLRAYESRWTRLLCATAGTKHGELRKEVAAPGGDGPREVEAPNGQVLAVSSIHALTLASLAFSCLRGGLSVFAPHD